MLLTGRLIATLVTLAIAGSGAAWGVHSLTSPEGSGSDYGLDTDGDGKFDFLVIDATVSLPEAGVWDMSASLSATSPPPLGACDHGFVRIPTPILGPQEAGYPIAWVYERYFFSAGTQTVRMAFEGTEIARAGVDGPFVVHAQMSLGGYGWPMDRLVPPSGVQWTYTTSAYAARDFDPPVRPATFTGTHSDAAVDIDDDGLADFLELRAGVKVDVGGPFSLSGYLAKGSAANGTWMIAYAYGHFELKTGDTEVLLRFPGDQIRQAGVDGPWNFTLTLYGAWPYMTDNATVLAGAPDGRAAPWQMVYPETLCGLTAPYAASQFDDTMELLRYTGQFDEVTPDSDADGSYDALVIRAEVEVFFASGFDLAGVLRPSTGSADVARCMGQTWLAEGVQSVDFAFSGSEINRSGINGPYRATLSITPSVVGIDPTTNYTTRAYRAADFDAEVANATRGYWIESLGAAVRGSGLSISINVVRGDDFLTVVIQDALTVAVTDGAGTVVGTFSGRVYLPSGGASQSFTYALDGLASGTYTVTAVLGDPQVPVDMRTVTVSV